MEVIDFRVRLRTKEGLKAWAPVAAPHFAQYVELYKMAPRLTFLTVEQNILEMETHGISRAVICAGNAEENEIISSICAEFPDRFIGIASVSLSKGVSGCYSDLKKAYEEYGLRGLSLGPYITGVRADSAVYYPLYTLSTTMDKCVIIHSSLHYNLGQPLDMGNPKHFDQVAVHFPDLKLVMSHAGNGFGLLPLAMAQRHPNIYLEFSGLQPKYIRTQVMHAANSYLSHKCLFGTDYPLLDFSVINKWKEAISPRNQDKFFSKNALSCLGIKE